jgi:hypothetical protein
MKGRTGAAVINVASISGWSPRLAMLCLRREQQL